VTARWRTGRTKIARSDPEKIFSGNEPLREDCPRLLETGFASERLRGLACGEAIRPAWHPVTDRPDLRSPAASSIATALSPRTGMQNANHPIGKGQVNVMNYASQILGFPAISQAEANRVGVVSAVYLDAEQRRVAGLGISTRRVGGEELFVPISEIVRVGRDVVLISTEGAAKEMTGDTPSPGRNVKDLHGVRVTTMDGHHLGNVEDFRFSTDWMIAELALTDNKALVIDHTSLTIADEVLVPADCANKIRDDKDNPRGRGRAFARAALKDTKRVLKRAWSWTGNGGSGDDSHDGKPAPR
jgi:uncharacterized protein YrrD